jgi:cation:H+ antiporter
MLIQLGLVVIGLLALVFGGDYLVKGAVGIAAKAKLSKLVIGMTVVSFGTSAPELIVSIKAALAGSPEIAIGNIVGSNIANIALVLGLTVLIFPMPVGQNSVKFDWPMMALSTLLFYLFALNMNIERWEGMVMFSLLVGFIVFLIWNSRRSNRRMDELVTEDIPTGKINIWKYVLFLAIGLVGLFFGARWLIAGATELALQWGLSERVIGITIVAFGTSVPELVTSVVAAYRKETDISVGNLIGSNIFNIMVVLAVTAMVQPIGVTEEVIRYDMIWMMAISVALFPMMVIGRRIGRFSGGLLLGAYIVYILLLFK